MSVFSRKLNKIMKERGLTPRTLSKLANISRNSVYDYLNDSHEPTTKNLFKIANALNIDVESLTKEDSSSKNEVSSLIIDTITNNADCVIENKKENNTLVSYFVIKDEKKVLQVVKDLSHNLVSVNLVNSKTKLFKDIMNAKA